MHISLSYAFVALLKLVKYFFVGKRNYKNISIKCCRKVKKTLIKKNIYDIKKM